MLVFASISPHPPIILPSVGSKEDREKVKTTIESLEFLGGELKKASPDLIIISSPHPDWGFNVPLFFLAKDFKGEIKTYLMGMESPAFYFEEGKKLYTKYNIQYTKYKVAVIASGDLSHCLQEDGPYGFHPDGPKFDEKLIESKEIIKIFLKAVKEENKYFLDKFKDKKNLIYIQKLAELEISKIYSDLGIQFTLMGLGLALFIVGFGNLTSAPNFVLYFWAIAGIFIIIIGIFWSSYSRWRIRARIDFLNDIILQVERRLP